MASTIVRKNITMEKKRLKKYENFMHKNGFSTFSHMIRYAMDELIKREKGKSSKVNSEISERIDIFQDFAIKKFDLLNERIEFIGMRINRDGITNDVGPAMHKIAHLLLKDDFDHSQLLLKIKKYDDKSVDTALSLMLDAEIIGSRKK